ncbi:MAG TPA: ATP-grasp domain-containing protein [Thermoanaerobaculia bacterium]
MPRVLLLLPTTTYRTPDFLAAAERLGFDVTVASEEASTLERLNLSGLLTLDFENPSLAAERVKEFARRFPIDAVVGADDETVIASAAIAEALGLPHNSAEAVLAARHKPTMRLRLNEARVPQPRFRLFSIEEEPSRAASAVSFPCVLKPTFLAASRGVIRADDAARFAEAWRRIEKILTEPDVRRRGGEWSREILVEEYVPGTEVALEGLLREGELVTLALFDKPDPMEGPFFEETIYVTPSRVSEGTRRSVRDTAARAAAAIGLRHGPVHAELRIPPDGPCVIEIAGRSIGGLCSRTLRFGTGMSLEELLLKDALGLDVAQEERESRAAGVLMLPIPGAGKLEEIRGAAEARAVPGIEEVTISAHLGQRLVPLPEGSRYLGFVFARAESPELVEAALREAHRRLEFRIRA